MEINNTKDFVHYMTVLKEIETNYYKHKVCKLNELVKQNPHNIIYKHKYKMASNRFKHLLKTSEDLKELKKDLKKI